MKSKSKHTGEVLLHEHWNDCLNALEPRLQP